MLRHLTDLQLLLVLAEMCGLFAVCALPAALEAELSRAIDSGAISTTFGWVRCPSEDGTASNLWRRDALVLGGDTTSSPRARWTCRSTWSTPIDVFLLSACFCTKKINGLGMHCLPCFALPIRRQFFTGMLYPFMLQRCIVRTRLFYLWERAEQEKARILRCG